MAAKPLLRPLEPRLALEADFSGAVQHVLRQPGILLRKVPHFAVSLASGPLKRLAQQRLPEPVKRSVVNSGGGRDLGGLQIRPVQQPLLCQTFQVN